MTKIPEALKPLVAETAHALRGHLQMLAELGVTGLPAATVTTSKPAEPVAAKAVGPSAPPPPAAVPKAPPPPAPKPVAPPVNSHGRMPWERHLGGAPEAAVVEKRAAPSAPPVEKALPVAPVVVEKPLPMAPRVDVVPGAAGLKIIQDDLGDCRRCKLWTGRTNIVFGVGNPHAEIVFVGEGPGADEDMQGEPFVGKAGQLLTQMIKAMGFNRDEVYICNVVKCRPPNNREPEPDEVAACSTFLEQQIQAVKPKVIVGLGRTAVQALMRSKISITKVRGTWQDYDGIPLMPTFHPSYLLRDPTQKRPAWEDLKSVLHKLGRPVPQPRKDA